MSFLLAVSVVALLADLLPLVVDTEDLLLGVAVFRLEAVLLLGDTGTLSLGFVSVLLDADILLLDVGGMQADEVALSSGVVSSFGVVTLFFRRLRGPLLLVIVTGLVMDALVTQKHGSN